MEPTIKIIIVDDHTIFRQGLAFVLSQLKNFKIIGEAGNGVELLKLLNAKVPDILLMDISMPEMGGVETTEKALKMHPLLKIIALSSFGHESYYYSMIKAGVMGFIEKKAGKNEIEEAIRSVMEGNNYFPQDILRKLIFKVSNQQSTELGVDNVEISIREKQVLTLICQGLSNNEIAEKLFISPKTVDNHRTHLLAKTQTKNAAHLVMFALKHNILSI